MTQTCYAPGLEWRSRKSGKVAYWVAPADARKRGFKPATVRLGFDDEAVMAATCRSLQSEVREHVEGRGDARITDLHIWRLGPGAHAAIVSVVGDIDGDTIRARLAPVHELAHLTVELRAGP